MIYSLFKKSLVRSFEEPTITKPLYLRHVQSAENGVMTRKSVFEVIDYDKLNSAFKHEDFQLDNIVSVGALHMLKPVVMQSSSHFAVPDQFENVDISDLTSNVSES